jgi:uncharacterized protein
MNRAEIILLLQRHRAELERLGVEHLFLFGSVGRSDARDDSDIDLFFDHAKGKLGLYEFMDLKERAQEILGRNKICLFSTRPAEKNWQGNKPFRSPDAAAV